MNNKRILNYSMVAAYTILLMIVAAIVELALFKVAAPDGLIAISEGLAETGFSVTVITVSILAVITNISERRFFGVKAGEYLKFRRRKLSPGFYDVLIIIVLVGALQYVALAADFRFAAAVMFLEIIALLIVQIRWGLGIAFFYYGKEREIRAFFIDEIKDNLKIVADEKTGQRKIDRAQQAVGSRIDNLFTHTKNAVGRQESSQIQQNLNMMANILDLLLDNRYQSVWHNYETRVDYLISSILPDEELGEYASSALLKMTDIILATKESGDKQIAKNCDFDQSRNRAYKMVTYASAMLLQSMFDKQIFYKLAAVKIYGIDNAERKVSRYALYADQFAEHVAASKHLEEINAMVTTSLRKLAPLCFANGKATDTAIYFSLVVRALEKNGVPTDALWEEANNHEEENGKQSAGVGMLKSVHDVQNGDELSDDEKKTVESFTKLIE
ncbi:MAG: hypothetical protein HN948_10250, partial [Clostridia bacterium]|nr:hypothetical protein [Clostridia bacterium]